MLAVQQSAPARVVFPLKTGDTPVTLKITPSRDGEQCVSFEDTPNFNINCGGWASFDLLVGCGTTNNLSAGDHWLTVLDSAGGVIFEQKLTVYPP